MKFLLLFLLLAVVGGLYRADQPRARAWPLVPMAFGLASLYLSLEMI